MRVCVLMPWGRVGSNLMMNYLRSCLSGEFANEPFNQIKTQDGQIGWLKDFYGSDGAGVDRCAKLSVRSLARLNPVQEFMNVHDVNVIRMFRRNHLKTAISQMRAEAYARQSEAQTGQAQWAVYKSDKPLAATDIDIETLEKRMEIIVHDQEDLGAMYFHNQHDVFYEDLNANLMAELGRVSEYLGRKTNDAYEAPFRKATSDDLRDVIRNYDDVKHWLETSQYSNDMLES